MEFTFSIRGAIKEAWGLFKKHLWFFVGLAAVSVVLNLLGNIKNLPFIVSILLMLATFIWSIVWIKFSLAAADGKEELFSFSKIQSMLPDFQQILGVLGITLISAFLFVCGLVLLIIPGLWIIFRLSVATLSYVDKGEGIKKALRASWHMTKGNVFWTAVLVSLASLVLYIVGIIFFGIGILVTYPVVMILMAKFYRALTNYHGQFQTIVPQPAEVEAPSQAL